MVKLEPIQTLRAKYSLGFIDMLRSASVPMRDSFLLVSRNLSYWWSSTFITPGTQSLPPSVRMSFRLGWRSNTPAKMSIQRARCEKNPASINHIAMVAS